MSTSYILTESNCFKVKDMGQVEQVLNALHFETYLHEEGIMFCSNDFCFDEDIDLYFSGDKFVGVDNPSFDEYFDEKIYCKEHKGERLSRLPLMTYLQEQLLDKQYIVVETVGFEGRNSQYYDGYAYCDIITKGSVDTISLDDGINKILKKRGVIK